jgi:hypothetical protein
MLHFYFKYVNALLIQVLVLWFMLNFLYGHFIEIKGFKTHISPKYCLFSSNMTLAVHLGISQLSAFYVRQGGLRNRTFSWYSKVTKSSVCLIKDHAKKVYGGVCLQLCPFLTFALHAPVTVPPGTHWIGVWVGPLAHWYRCIKIKSIQSENTEYIFLVLCRVSTRTLVMSDLSMAYCIRHGVRWFQKSRFYIKKHNY